MGDKMSASLLCVASADDEVYVGLIDSSRKVYGSRKLEGDDVDSSVLGRKVDEGTADSSVLGKKLEADPEPRV